MPTSDDLDDDSPPQAAFLGIVAGVLAGALVWAVAVMVMKWWWN